MRLKAFGIIALLCLNLLTTSAQHASLAMRPTGVSEEYVLLRYLLTNYSKVARPVARSNDAVLVLARLFPIKLLNMYEKNEVLEMTMRLQLTWRDRMLVWQPGDFNNQSTVVIPGGQLWIPDLQIVNSVSDLYALLRDQKFDFKVHNDGSVWWHPTGNLVTRCELHLMYFPFDYQRCPIMLESAIYSHMQLNLTVRTDRAPVSLSMYAESGHWDLLKVTGQPRVLWVTNSTAFTRVEFWLYLGRKTTYFKMNIIFPCCMLSGLQMLTFFFPLESTERVPEATSILLSVIVFQTMIVDQLPRSSNSIPLLCIYVDMLTGISVLAVAEAVIVASLVSRKGLRTKAPKWAHGFLRFIYKWNTDGNKNGRHSGGLNLRSRSSFGFLRNANALQNFMSGASFRRKANRSQNPNQSPKLSGAGGSLRPNASTSFILDNMNISSVDSNSGAIEESPDFRSKSLAMVRRSNLCQEASYGSSKANLQQIPSAPSVTVLPANGMIVSSVKLLPRIGSGLGDGGVELIGQFGNNNNDSSSNNNNNLNDSLLKLADAPLADFDPDSSIMMTSSVFGGSAVQASALSGAVPPSLMSSSYPVSGGNGNLDMPPPLSAELFADDTNSIIDDAWQPVGTRSGVDVQMSMMSFSSMSTSRLPPNLPILLPPQQQQQQQSQSSQLARRPTVSSAGNNLASGKNSLTNKPELSPLLTPRKVPERQYSFVDKRYLNESPNHSPLLPSRVPSNNAPLATTAAFTAGGLTLGSGTGSHPRLTASVSGGLRDGRASQGNLSLNLPGIPRQPIMRRSRPSLFIPSADSDDIILDWIYLARVLDAVMFLICLTVVIVVPVVLFGILPPTTVEGM